MAKTAAGQFSCTEGGYTAGRWFGKCPGCSAFGTLVEEVIGQAAQSQAPPKPLLRLVDVEVAEAARIPTGVPELDRVLGGGLVPGSLVLLGGEPGVGKSTLLLSALAAVSRERRGPRRPRRGAGAAGEGGAGRGRGGGGGGGPPGGGGGGG